MPRETATERADMPHEFVQAGRVCVTCGAGADDQMHQAWAKVDLASRETAATNKISWEKGS